MENQSLENQSLENCRSWSLPPSHIVLGDADLHIWRASLDFPVATVKRLRQILSSDEQARADRFHFPIDRTRFIAARGCLRTILGRYMQVDPSEIRFSYGAHGKPSIAKTSAVAADLSFNLAHSGGHALCAVTRGCEIGVDLEEIRTDFATDKIAERFFSANEVAWLCAQPASEQLQAFFNCWTRKEALLKAMGSGLSDARDQLEIITGPHRSTVLLNEASSWILKSIDLGSDFAASVAFQGHDRRIWYWDLEKDMI